MKRLVLLLALCACAGGALGVAYSGNAITPQLIGQRGTHVFAGEPGDVFRATVGALQAVGYEIAFSDEAAGIIKTAPKPVRSYSDGTTQVLTYTRSYAVRLTRQPQSVVVEVTPKIFQNGADISEQPVWDLSSPMGEYALWDQLFREIRTNLGRG